MAVIRKNWKLDAVISDPQHLVNKGYVDNLLTGKIKDAVRFASINNQAGTYNGTGKTFTSTTNGAITLDGAVGVVNDRVLLKNQNTATQNGIYVITTVGNASTPYVLTRSTDFIGSQPNNLIINIMEGTVNADTAWTLTNDGSIIIDTTGLTFQKFPNIAAGGGSVNKYTETVTGDGIVLSISINHNLGTQDITFNIIETGTYEVMYAGISNMNNNTIIFTFDTPLASGKSYRVTVIG